MAPSVTEPDPLGAIRTILIWSLLAGSTGTLLELLLIGHDEMAAQWAPLVLLAAGILVTAWTLIAPRVVTIRALQVLMVIFVTSGLVGVFLHYKGNEAFELEMTPSRAGISLDVQDLDRRDAGARARVDVAARVRGIGFRPPPSAATIAEPHIRGEAVMKRGLAAVCTRGRP